MARTFMQRVMSVYSELKSDLFSKEIEWKFRTTNTQIVYFPVAYAGYKKELPRRNSWITIMKHPTIKGSGIRIEWRDPEYAIIRGRVDLDLYDFYIKLIKQDAYETNLHPTIRSPILAEIREGKEIPLPKVGEIEPNFVGKIEELLKKYGFTRQLKS